MEQQINHLQNIWERNKMLVKGFLIGFLTLIMLIPVGLLSDLVSEREQRQNEVISEVSSKWASDQTIVGPLIAVPYISRSDSGKAVAKRNLYLLPEQLNINGKILPEIRHRSLYDVSLYRSQLTLSGTFDPGFVEKLNIPQEDILWNESHLMLGLDDARGLEDNVIMQWADSNIQLEAGLPGNNVIKSGLSSPVAINAQGKISFNIHVKIKGSAQLYFTPTGKTTTASISSPWKHPAFDGQYLPSKSVDITDNGFSADWKILQVSRNYPQAWKDFAEFYLENSAFGVKLLQPADSYSKTQRSVKYAVLIIALTFTIFFFLEILQKRHVHPLQYVLVGVALCVFYTLLLSISEYTGFNKAYAIASVATVVLISLYVSGIFKKLRITAGFTASLSALYVYIFILIQLQDYALLCGSIGLFVILAIIMYFSRKIDWYGTGNIIKT